MFLLKKPYQNYHFYDFSNIIQLKASIFIKFSQSKSFLMM